MMLSISRILYADDTVLFCEANQEQLMHLRWTLMWFEAVSRLKVYMSKSEIILVGRVEYVEGLAVELGCNIGFLASTYLGLPLGVPHNSVGAWDFVEERFHKRLAPWKR